MNWWERENLKDEQEIKGLFLIMFSLLLGALLIAMIPKVFANDEYAYFRYENNLSDETGNYVQVGSSSYAKGKFGQGLWRTENFNVISGLNVSRNTTIVLWFNQTTAITQSPISKGYEQFYTEARTNGFKCAYQNATNEISVLSPTIPPINQWNMAICKLNDTHLCSGINLDGENCVLLSGAIKTSDLNVVIGAGTESTTDQDFTGIIDEIRFINRSISGYERQKLYVFNSLKNLSCAGNFSEQWSTPDCSLTTSENITRDIGMYDGCDSITYIHQEKEVNCSIYNEQKNQLDRNLLIALIGFFSLAVYLHLKGNFQISFVFGTLGSLFAVTYGIRSSMWYIQLGMLITILIPMALYFVRVKAWWMGR